MSCFHGSPDSDSSLNMTHHYARLMNLKYSQWPLKVLSLSEMKAR